jgi:Big-like domain-containing protein/lamin tail-like protein/Calx-beta domain-containing protein
LLEIERVNKLSLPTNSKPDRRFIFKVNRHSQFGRIRIQALLVFVVALVLNLGLYQLFLRPSQAVSTGIVISQVYGGAGCGTAGCSTYKNDYIELFNRGGSAVSVNGWSVQYAAATGTSSWQVTNLPNVSIQPGQYFLVAESFGTNGVNNLPTPDVTGTIAMSATAGKVALVNTTTALSGACPASASIVDLIGYGSTANCFETAVAPAPSTTTADIRGANGCTETDTNSTDFTAAAPNPRNTGVAFNPCGGGDAAPAVSSTTPADAATNVAANTDITTNFSEPVNVTGSWFQINCSTSGMHTAAVTGGPTAFTLNPDSDFTLGDVCTVTINHLLVNDQDLNDPPDNMAADYVFSFTVGPTLSINDVKQLETNAGTTTFSFNVSLNAPATSTVTFNIATADGTAQDGNPFGEDNDYVAKSETGRTITAGNSSATFTVTVNGDPTVEPDETFFVNVSNVTGAAVIDGQGLGTIANDDGVGSSSVVISQVYGGGGNSGSTYKNDFIELYNRGASPVNVTGWSVQYAGATAAFMPQTTPTPPGVATPLTTTLSGTIQPGHYYLIQEAPGAGGTTDLPTPDQTGGILIGATAGKVALVNNTTVLSTNCPNFAANGIVDFVGFGPTADCWETAPSSGSPTAVLANTTAAIRKLNGCQDTDNNGFDFSVDIPIPRNSLNANSCAAAGTLFASGAANPSSIDPGGSSLLAVSVTPATGPNSTGISVAGNLSSIGGSTTQQFYDDGTHGDVTIGDNVFSFFATTPANASTGAKPIPFNVSDAQARNAAGTITISLTSPTCGVERWTIKVGTDPDAGLVNLTKATPVTVATMRSWPAPSPTPPTSRVAPYETTVWIINGTITDYKEESDVDYHVVVQDGASNTVITEIPCPCCGIGSPFQARMSGARQTFDSKLTATTSFQHPNIPVRVTGVGFFDFLHGQTGVAPNGIELHTILDIAFPTTQTVFTTNGPNVNVQAGDVNIKFGNVSESGNTTVAPIDPSTAGPPLGGYSLVGPGFNITTNTSSSGPYNICISVPYITEPTAFRMLKILHNEGGTLVDRTTGQDPINKIVCSNAPTLSPFVVALGSTPTAEVAKVSGHIADADGRSVEGAAIRMNGTQNRLTITDGAGNYHFDGLEANGFYTITPTRANYVFSPASRSFSALGYHIDAAFTATNMGARANPLDMTEYFVRQHYLDFLGREPEEAGLNGWVNTIDNCASVDTRCDRVHVSEAFFRSLEFQERGYFLYRFYSTALGRKPDYSEFAPDLAGVSGFLDSAQLEAAKAAFVNNFTVRPAFMARYDSLNNAEYVNALMSTAGVNLADRQSLIDALNTGAQTRAKVLRQIVESSEVYARYYNQAFVVMEYFGYLQRDPDALYLNWIVTLDANPADSRRMVEGFVNAAEYRNRFAR